VLPQTPRWISGGCFAAGEGRARMKGEQSEGAEGGSEEERGGRAEREEGRRGKGGLTRCLGGEGSLRLVLTLTFSVVIIQSEPPLDKLPQLTRARVVSIIKVTYRRV